MWELMTLEENLPTITLTMSNLSPLYSLSFSQSPIKADLYASLDVKSAQPKSIAVAKQHLYQQSPVTASASAKPKKLRHRRIASGSGAGIYLNASGASPKSSPVRDRRLYQSDPEVSRKIVQLVDTETQTDHSAIVMDMSETEATSPSPFVASRELAMCLRDSGRGRSIGEDLNTYGVIDVNRNDNSPGDQERSNGNHSSRSMSRSDLTFQDACSGSDDPLDDVTNSNDRLDERTPDDDDNLEKLGRRVSEFFTENRHSIQSTHSDNGNNGNGTTTLLASADMLDEHQTKQTITDVATEQIGHISQGGRLDVNSTAARRGFISCTGDGKEVTVIRCSNGPQDDEDEDFCNDSWTDEEGEDPDKQYLYLRRKR